MPGDRFSSYKLTFTSSWLFTLTAEGRVFPEIKIFIIISWQVFYFSSRTGRRLPSPLEVTCSISFRLSINHESTSWVRSKRPAVPERNQERRFLEQCDSGLHLLGVSFGEPAGRRACALLTPSSRSSSRQPYSDLPGRPSFQGGI